MHHFIEIHGAAFALFTRRGVGRGFDLLVLAGDVFDADHQAGLAGDGRPIGQPAGAAAHALGQEIGTVGLRVGHPGPRAFHLCRGIAALRTFHRGMKSGFRRIQPLLRCRHLPGRGRSGGFQPGQRFHVPPRLIAVQPRPGNVAG